MRKYFTWRCIGLHVLAAVLVPTFLFLGRWQYHAAVRGNSLSWVYTVEWPIFAVYAVYMWWKLIHEKPTPFDRLWAVRERAAAEAAGTPLQQIPGWALDKSLARAVARSSSEQPEAPTLARVASPAAIGLPASDQVPDQVADQVAGLRAPSRGAWPGPTAGTGTEAPTPAGGSRRDVPDQVIDARVVRVEVAEEDPELTAYNRYLAELNRIDPPKQW